MQGGHVKHICETQGGQDPQKVDQRPCGMSHIPHLTHVLNV